MSQIAEKTLQCISNIFVTNGGALAVSEHLTSYPKVTLTRFGYLPALFCTNQTAVLARLQARAVSMTAIVA